MGSTRNAYENLTVELVRDIRPVLISFYLGECDDFFRTCHKANGGLVECVDDMCETISDNADFFVMNHGRERAAFFVRTQYEDKMVLEGFHVKKGFRLPMIFQQFWKIVNDAMGGDYYVGILQGNLRAIKHLQKYGFVSIGLVEDRGKIFNLLNNKII